MSEAMFQPTLQSKAIAGDLAHKLGDVVLSKTISAIDTVGQAAEAASKTRDRLADALHRSLGGVNELARYLTDMLAEASSKAARVLTDTTTQATHEVETTAGHAAALLDEATNATVRHLSDAARAVERSAEQVRQVLDATARQAEQLHDSVAGGVRDAIASSIADWMAHHPMVAWALHHPMGAGVCVLVVSSLVWGLLGAIGQLTRQAWLVLLKATFDIVAMQVAWLGQHLRVKALPRDREADNRLPEILTRLEALKLEQAALLEEMKSILLTKP